MRQRLGVGREWQTIVAMNSHRDVKQWNPKQRLISLDPWQWNLETFPNLNKGFKFRPMFVARSIDIART